jgi:hypothetical protein
MTPIAGWSPLSAAGFGGGVVGPAGRGCACALTSTGEPTAVAPTKLAAFKKPRLLTVEVRFHTASSHTAAIHSPNDNAEMSRVGKCVSTVSPFAKTGLIAPVTPGALSSRVVPDLLFMPKLGEAYRVFFTYLSKAVPEIAAAAMSGCRA